MADVSQVSRYRPAVAALVSLAAICGIYYALRSEHAAGPEKSTLHRSNAVHRPRSGRSRLKAEVIPPDLEAPLGSLIIRRGDQVLITNLAEDVMPSRAAVTSIIGEIPDDFWRDALRMGLFAILLHCTHLETAEMRRRLVNTIFERFPEAMERRDPSELERIREIMAYQLPDLQSGIIDQAFDNFLEDPTMQAEEASSSVSTNSGEAFAETEDFEAVNGTTKEPSQGIKGLLYYIAEQDARRKAYEHRGITCEVCGESPIRGVRYHCLQCPDYDLCENCEPHTQHTKTHVFAKIKIPLPVLSQPTKRIPLWYPGDPRKQHSPLDPNVRKRLAAQYSFEEPSIDAFYDQFTCTANVPWAADPTKVAAAIDKRAFSKALTPETWQKRFAPNVLYDRMFAFYDTDCNGLLSFEEFVSGMSYLRGPKRFTPLRRALQGFDIDGDGFVDRSDFMRIFRAKYEVNKQLVNDMVEGQESEQTMDAMEVLRSTQPISSVFNEEEIPQGEVRPMTGKSADGPDMRPLPGSSAILDDSHPWPRASTTATVTDRLASNVSSPERLRRHLSRFEEMLNGTSNQQGSEQQGLPDVDGARLAERDHTTEDSASSSTLLDDRIVQDALLEVVEQGLNEMLDRIFKDKELQSEDVVNTRSERQQRKAEIDQARAERQAFQQELHNAALVDPLMATAMESFGAVKVERKPTETKEPAFRGEIVPTDTESLAYREEEISQKPLEQLLEATGYGVVDDDHQSQPPPEITTAGPLQSRSAATEREVQLQAQDGQSDDVDPTLPQHRPSARSSSTSPSEPKVCSSPQEDGLATSSEDAERLEYLASLDDGEREMHERGGQGRLSLDEVESMVRADSTKELRGMVTSWLEWASF